MAFFEVSVELG